MGLFKRIGDILAANLNEMIESFEDPEKMLKQAVQEMERAIHEATAETARTLANEKRLVKELANNENQARHWQNRAELAVEHGNDDLARTALVRKQEHDRIALSLRDELSAVDVTYRTLRNQLDAMKAKLKDARRSLATLAARNRAASMRQAAYAGQQQTRLGLSDNAFHKFDQLRERVEQSEAEVEALAELQGIVCTTDSVSHLLDARDEIEAELALLKQKSTA